MLRRKTIYRDMADVNIYTAKRLGDMALSLGELAKSCEEESGKDRTLTKEDGLAAVNAAALLVCGSCEKNTMCDLKSATIASCDRVQKQYGVKKI